MRRSRGRSKFRRLVEGLLLLAGVIGIGAWAWWNIRGSVMQDWQSWVFDRRVHGQSAPITEYLSERSAKVMGDVRAWLKMPPAAKPTPALPTPPPSSAGPVAPPERPPAAPSVPPNGLLGRLDIPRLHLKAMVREGVDEDTLGVALGHIPSTAFPGQSGNVGVAGHRDKLFRGLRKIHKDDLIQFETLGASYEYKVESTEIVKPADVGVLTAGQYPELTLVTCYPFYYVGPAPKRFIVEATKN